MSSAQFQTRSGLAEILKLFQEEGGFDRLTDFVLERHREVLKERKVLDGTLGCGIAVDYASNAMREVLQKAKQSDLLEAFDYIKPARFMGMPREQDAHEAEMARIRDTLTCIAKEAARKACKAAMQGDASSKRKKCADKDKQKPADFQDSRSGESKMERHWGGPVKGNLARQGHFNHAAAR